ncbi:MAG: aldehyde dehydrogenase (NADP(+)) [Actinomycetota bacterium]|jgi:NADP-dependent aldehyde dehydrogenase|nr:aldehyde dehydrogenase (NADP(+)) [Actinomycetota bacterium]
MSARVEPDNAAQSPVHPVETNPEAVDALVGAATTAAKWMKDRTPAERGKLLQAVASALDVRGEAFVDVAERESHLGRDRLRGELARTTFQLRFFADVLAAGWVTPAIVDRADPNWPVGPRPDLRRALFPIGPVVVFAAGNFPFAFSVAGGDTASALAAGCPVLLKAHPGHLELSAMVARTVMEALNLCGAPSGAFTLVVGDEAGRAVLGHPGVRAAAFTGSMHVGRVLFDLANRRPIPIPFYGELGSVNPVFVTERAAAARLDSILNGFLQSFGLGSGQFCTKPGILVVPAKSSAADELGKRMSERRPSLLLSESITAAYRARVAELTSSLAARIVHAGEVTDAGVTPTLIEAPMEAARSDLENLATECFGPAAVVVTCTSHDEMIELATSLEGQLTGTVFGDEDDPVAAALVEVLAERVGRVVWNDWPTGVSVTWAMHHGGPYPATTAPLSTSVGATAILRFLRPVVFQQVPNAVLPPALRDNQLSEALHASDGRWQAAR